MLHLYSLLRKHCSLFSSVFVPLHSHLLYSTKVTTSFSIIYPSMHIAAPLGGSPFALQCPFAFFHTSHSGATSSVFLSFIWGHSHFLCPSSSYLKHCGLSSTISCLLTSLTPHCITQLSNILNLFPSAVFFLCSSLLLQFRVRYPNFLHHLHNFLSLPSNSALNLVRACLWLSITNSHLLDL